MRAFLSAIVALAVVVSAPAAVDKKKLRELLTFPLPEVNAGFNFSANGSLVMTWDQAGTSEGIEAVRKTLKGDASDADRYARLGQLYSDAGDRQKSDESSSKAAELYRERLKAHPNDPAVLAKLGACLDSLAKRDEAEKLLRRAVELNPKQPDAWTALGSLVQGKALSALTGLSDTELGNPLKLMTALQASPSLDKRKQYDKLTAEALDCHNKAIAAAPELAAPYAGRAGFYSLRGLVLICQLGSNATPDATMDLMLSKEEVSDLLQVAKLSPDDYRAIGVGAFIPVMLELIHKEKQPDLLAGGAWAGLSASTKATAKDAMARLQKLADAGGPTTAGVLEILGFIQAICAEPAAAEASFKRATTLDPARDQVWQMRIAVASKRGKKDDAIAICTERLKLGESAQFLFDRATLYVRANQMDGTERDVDAALKAAPDDFNANVAKAVLLIKKSDDQDGWKKAKAILDEVQKRSAQIGDAQRTALAFATGVCAALLDDIPSAKAWLGVASASASDDDSKPIKQALEIVSKG